MLILGIDSSGKACTAALSENDAIIDSFSVVSQRSHSDMLLPKIEKLLNDNSKKISDVNLIAVSHGPGSYTGLRIGISTVKGLSVSLGINTIGVSSLEALAYNDAFPEETVISSLIDARRDEFYQAFFRIKNGIPERITDDRAIVFEDLIKETDSFQNVALIGDGAEKFIKMSGKEYKTVPFEKNFGNAESVSKLGYKLRNKATDCKLLSPKYLKLSQAEREINNK